MLRDHPSVNMVNRSSQYNHNIHHYQSCFYFVLCFCLVSFSHIIYLDIPVYPITIYLYYLMMQHRHHHPFDSRIPLYSYLIFSITPCVYGADSPILIDLHILSHCEHITTLCVDVYRTYYFLSEPIRS